MKRPYPRTVVLVLSALVVFAIVLLDRMTKVWAMARVPGDLELVPRFLAITHHQNFGLIANLPAPQAMIVFVTSVVLCIVVYFCIRAIFCRNLIESTAFAGIIGGAIGNLWDRLSYGYVADWLMFFHRSILNIADIAIGLGIVVILFLTRPKHIEE